MASSRMRTPAKKKGRTASRPKWVEVLVDIVLGLLSRPQQLWRNVIDRTFSTFLPFLTAEAVELIVKVSAQCRMVQEEVNLSVLCGV